MESIKIKKDMQAEYQNLTQRFCGNMEVHPWTMSGSGGEICKIDFEDGSDVVRVKLGRFFGGTEDERFRYVFLDGLEISVLRFHGVAGTSATLWDNDAEVLCTKRFWMVDNVRGIYTDSLDELAEIVRVRHERWLKGRKASHTFHGDAKRLAAIVRKRYGFGRCKVSDIDHVVRHSNFYEIMLKREFGKYGSKVLVSL